ncbi:MAG: hypothetical protein JSR82_15070 [Verrucomicrobia bacterium]|nr:hypothetical protein [Verrucomicrobiota bacterium]
MNPPQNLLTATLRAELRCGDIVFTAIKSPLYRKVAETCGSWDSHVGILFRNPDGRLVVAESRVPISTYTSLDRFLARSEEGAFAIRRLRGGLTDEQAARLRAECDRRMRRVYHLGFDFDANREFCSKLVYGAYLDALGVEIGRLETFRELLSSNPAAPLRFWRAWFFGFIPWRRRTVTPTSQLRSELLEAVA